MEQGKQELLDKLKTAERRIYFLERENAILKYDLVSANIKADQAKRMLILVRQVENGMSEISESDKERAWYQPTPTIMQPEQYDYVNDTAEFNKNGGLE